MEMVKNKSWQNWQFKDLDRKGMVQIAVNAFNNTDEDGDVSLPGSFKKTLKENFSRVRWFLNHDTTILLGVPVKGYETSDHLVMEARFNMEKQIARDTYEDYKLYAEHDKTLEHSVGLQAIKYEIDKEMQTRKVSEWKLWEFSTLTSWGANQNTPLMNIKSQFNDDEINKLKRLLEKMGSNSNYSDTRKIEVEQTYESLFIKPSTMTLEQEADMSGLIAEIIKSNLFIKPHF